MAYRIRTEDVWDHARTDYLGGEPALVVCARYDLGLSALRKRARDEGWRRQDQPDPLIEPMRMPVMHDSEVGDMMDEALRRSLELAADGRIDQAGRWLRYHRGLQAVHDNDVKLARRLEERRHSSSPNELMLALREQVHQCTFANAGALSLSAPSTAAAAEPIALAAAPAPDA